MLFAIRSSRDQRNAGRRGFPPPAPGRQPQLSRPLVSLAVFTALAATLTALVYPIKPFAESRAGIGVNTAAAVVDDGQGTVDTPTGPVTPADREFVRKVRLAGLWELPSGKMALTRSSNEAVKRAGEHLIVGHSALDKSVVQVAQTLNIPVSNEPNDQQKGWLAQMDAAQGGAFDTAFTNLLRRAHGKVFPLVAETRAKTQNSLVRALANQANGIVLDHITMLEGTGMVDFPALSSG